MLRIAAASFLLLSHFATYSQTWDQAKVTKSAQLDIFWYVSTPFIYKDDRDVLTGIEYEMIDLFAVYLNDKHGVELKLNWVEAKNFSNIMEVVSQAQNSNTFGSSAFSITLSRQKILQFTNPYLPDIAVLVSSEGSPIVETPEEISKMMSNMAAVTIAGTTYEKFLNDLSDRLQIDFNTTYIDSDQNVLDQISQGPNQFGYIDLPIYLMLIKRGGSLTRQNKFTIRGTGYGLIMPQGSDWEIPFNAFIQDPDYKSRINALFSKFLGTELFNFLEELETETQLGASILTKEKELQLDLIRSTQLMLAKQQNYNRLLMAGIILCLILLLIIAWLFYRNKRTTAELLLRKTQIENHQTALQEKSEQLISRNAGLLALNEEKNNFVRILAHDLRSPLSQIIGIANILSDNQNESPETQKKLLTTISDGAQRINEMINKILNVESLDHKRSTTVFEQVKVAALIEEVAQRFASRAREKGIGISIVNCNSEYFIVTDQVLLLQVLDNLVSNAVKFSASGSQIEIEAKTGDKQLVISVKDEGPGFSEADQALMFNKFQKLSAQPTGNEPSTGLGLSIVKQYVEALNGKIRLETTVGKGSTFFVELVEERH